MSKRAAFWVAVIGVPVISVAVFAAFVVTDGGRQARLNAARDELIPPNAHVVFRGDCGELTVCSIAYLAPGERTLSDRLNDFEQVALKAGWEIVARNEEGGNHGVVRAKKGDLRASVTVKTDNALRSNNCPRVDASSLCNDYVQVKPR